MLTLIICIALGIVLGFWLIGHFRLAVTLVALGCLITALLFLMVTIPTFVQVVPSAAGLVVALVAGILLYPQYAKLLEKRRQQLQQKHTIQERVVGENDAKKTAETWVRSITRNVAVFEKELAIYLHDKTPDYKIGFIKKLNTLLLKAAHSSQTLSQSDKERILQELQTTAY